MPKKSVNINNFSGGLNNNTNARDIAANEFAVLNNLDNETPGKLKLFGNVDNYYSSGNYDETHSTFNEGNGLIYLSTDRDVDDTNPALSNHEILFINDARESLNKASMKKGNEALLPMAEMFTTGKRIHEVNHGK